MVQERRQFYRLPQPFEVRYRLFNELASSWRTVTTLNLSAGGIRFRDTETIELDALLELQMQLPGGREPFAIHGRVIWSQMQASGVTETGVAFLEVRPEQQQIIDNVVQFFRKSAVPPGSGPSSA